MAERYWEHPTTRNYVYIDEASRVIGRVYQRLADGGLEAVAYDQHVGEFAHIDAARTAVETACVGIEVERLRARDAQLAKLKQADGDTE